MSERQCNRCGKMKRESEFHLSGYIKKDGTHTRAGHCKECNLTKPSYQKEYWRKPENKARKKKNAHESYLRNKVKVLRRTRIALLRNRFGLTVEQYDKMLDSQFGVCKICGKPPSSKRLHVDHCHKSGKVRSLLCSQCNMMLGAAKDDPTCLRLAAIYLEEYNLE